MSRTRVTDSRKLVEYVVSDTSSEGIKSIWFGEPVCTGSHSSITDEVTPYFSKRKAKGEIILNPVNRSKYMRPSGVCSIQIGPHIGWGTRVITADFAAYGSGQNQNLFGTDIDCVLQSLLLDAYNKVDAPTILAAVDLKELGQTLSMLRNPFDGTRKLLNKILRSRRRRTKSGCSFAKATMDSWLEYRYGWKPLIGEISDVFDAVHTQKDTVKPVKAVARSGKRMPKRTLASTFSMQMPGLNSMTGTQTVEQEFDCHAGVLYRCRDFSDTSTLQRLLGLRFQDIPSTLWEIVPYSFVADWFFKIGDWLQAVTPKPGVDYLGNWVTTVSRTRVTRSNIKCNLYVNPPYPPNTGKTWSVDAKSVTEEFENFTRRVNEPLPPFPPLAVNPLTTPRIADALALSLNPLMDKMKSLRH